MLADEEDHSDALCPVDYEASMSHMGETGETQPLTAAEGMELFAAQSAEQRRMYEEIRSLISERPQVMPLKQPVPPPTSHANTSTPFCLT